MGLMCLVLKETHPSPVVEDIVEIPAELVFRQHLVDLYIDTFYVDGLPFLTSISKRILYRTCNRLVDRVMKHYRSALEEIFKIYESSRFAIA